MKMFNLLLIFLALHSVKAQKYSDSLDNELTKLYVNSALPGFGVSIVNKDGVLYQNGFGYANKEKGIPYTKNTIQPIASISKTFISVAIMKAIDDGYFTLETNINDILPFELKNPNFPDDMIRVKHLVTHTSGIVDKLNITYLKGYYLIDKPDYKNNKYTLAERKLLKLVSKNEEMTLEEYLKECLSENGKWYNKRSFSKHIAGDKYEYSNIGADLAAYIIEVATRKPFSSYTREIIIDPLKLNATAWKTNQLSKNKQAVLYTETGYPLPLYSNSSYPSGNLNCSYSDLSKFLIEIIKGYNGMGKLISPNSYKLMLSTIYKEDSSDENTEYAERGVFWEIRENGVIGHSGGNPGVTTLMYYSPEKEIGMILFANVEIENSKELTKQIISVWDILNKYGSKLGI